MKRGNGEAFWCHVTGRALNRAVPHQAGIWTFLDLSSRRPVKAELTAREREVAAWLMDGHTSKEIGRVLSISHRTVAPSLASCGLPVRITCDLAATIGAGAASPRVIGFPSNAPTGGWQYHSPNMN